jgi:M6 family metalloprotease-like protein
MDDAYPLNIAPRGLVILVNFADVAFTTEKSEMDSMLTGKNYTRDYSYTDRGQTYNVQSQGSARQYFEDVSFGQYNPQFDVVGPVTVSKEMSYYGQNDAYGSDKYAEIMIKEACELANTECNVDFSQYDNDEDGYVDFVFVIYAGYGEADGGKSNTIWPHAWNLLTAAGKRCEVDGKVVDLYACGNELDFYSKKHTGIGTFCHEFSHVLGLPDLYETDAMEPHGVKTLGAWSIMDYGPYNNEGNTPPAYSAYERFFMGWLMPELIVDTANITLQDLKESNRALLISSSDEHNLIGNDPKPTNFYLLENRQQKSWDEYLPGHGMMLTKIQYSYRKWNENTVNNKAKSMGVDLIEADGMTPNSKQNGYDGKPGDLFPAGATEYLGITDHSIEQVREKDGVIYFKYKGGVDDPDFDFETAVENVATATQVIAIYNILGQKQMTTHIESLPHGTYVVVTSKGNHKIVR